MKNRFDIKDVKIRKAKKKEFRDIAKIYAEAYSQPPYNEPWTTGKALKQINLFSKYCNIWSVILEKDIIGFIIINPNFWFPGKFCFAEDIAIKKELRGKGIGTFVIKKIMEMYKKNGFESFIGLANKDSRAFKLYQRLGIKENNVDVLIERKIK